VSLFHLGDEKTQRRRSSSISLIVGIIMEEQSTES